MKLARHLYQTLVYFYQIFSLKIVYQWIFSALLPNILLFAFIQGEQNLYQLPNQFAREHALTVYPTDYLKAESLSSGNQNIIFLGNKFFSLEKIRKKLFVLEDPGFIEPGLIMHDLLTLYRDHGFLDAKISFEQKEQNILFNIREGSQAKINEIFITGMVEQKFLAMIQNIVFELTQLDYFDRQLFNHLLDLVKEKFSTYGYWDFKVKNFNFILNKNSDYDLVLELDQGTLKLLKKIVIENDTKLDIDHVVSDLPILVDNIPFDFSLIESYKKQIYEAIYESGNEVLICCEVMVDKKNLHENSDELVLVLRITPKNDLYFGQIIIKGCLRTLPEIVRQTLVFKEGDIWDFDKIEQSLKKLKDLKIFNSVSIVPQDFFEKNLQKTIVVTVSEDSIFEAIGRCGFTQSGINSTQVFGLPSLTYRFGGSFLWKNISGLSDNFSLDLDFTGFSTNFAASYHKPFYSKYLSGLSFNSKIFNNQIEQPLPGIMGNVHQKAYVEKHTGILFNFAYDAKKFSLFLSTALDYIKISSSDFNLFKSLHIDSNFFNNRIPYTIFEPSILINRFDNEIEPTKGYRTSLSLKAMLPLSDISRSSFKLLFEHSHILPLTPNSSFAYRLRAGYIINKDIETIVPTERFYLGGLNSLRAYEFNMVPPMSSFSWDDNAASGLVGKGSGALRSKSPHIFVPMGAKFMINLNAEWRCKLYNKLSGIIFNDMGLLNHDRLNTISFKDIVGATGFGLRYATPLGPIRFDIGFKWKRQKDEKPFNWYLTFGHSF